MLYYRYGENMKRKFYEVLLNWKENNINTPLMVVGVRQIGKTYLIDQFCKQEFKDYIYINFMENQNIVNIFSEKLNFEDKIKKIELELNRKINEDTILFFDEIQISEEAISSLKLFCESSFPFKIVCAGSLLGVKINRFSSSFPVGKVRIEYMYPMDFEEFLNALGKDMWVDEIKRCFNTMEKISIHDKLINLYRLYLCVGGMPEAVKNFKNVNEDILLFNKRIIKDIIISYKADMSKYTKTTNESLKIERIYDKIPSILAKENKKFQYSDIDKNANKRDYESAVNWLISSNMVYECNLVNKIEVPLKVYEDKEYFKLYLSDVGILTSLLEINYRDILLNNNFMFKGSIAESYVAQVFRANEISLYYWKSGNKAEVDFLLYNDDGIIPVEVKASDNNKSKSLNIYVEKYKPKYAIRLSTKNFGFEKNIKSIPLYAAFLIK